MSGDVVKCGLKPSRTVPCVSRLATALEPRATRIASVQRVLASHFWSAPHDRQRDADVVALLPNR